MKTQKARKEKNEKPRGTFQSHLSAGQLLKSVLRLIDHLVGSTGEEGLSQEALLPYPQIAPGADV